MSNIPTPHITAKAGDFAPTVLMPGDPLRSRFVAENFLTDAVLVNNVRGVQGYTGLYKGKRVSVMASGMGMPSIGIYSHELFHFYGVEAIIRIGSAGMLRPDLRLRDIVAGMSCYTNSNFGAQFGFAGSLAPCCSFPLLRAAAEAAERIGARRGPRARVSAATVYDASHPHPPLQKRGGRAGGMEAAALYLNAARAGKQALALCTISDNPFTGEGLSAKERQESFREMMEIALEIAL